MKHVTLLESLEPRRLMSASASSLLKTPVTTIGPTSGVTPAVVLPEFKNLTGTKNGVDVETDTGLDRDTSLKIHIDAHNTGSIDATHLFRASVLVKDLTAGTTISSPDPMIGVNALSKIITSGGGDVIVITFKNLLTAGHSYSVELNSAATQTFSANSIIRTSNGSGSTNFADTTFNFSTGSFFAQPTPGFTSAFSTAVTQANAGSHGFTAVTMGPDGKLYAADTQGHIYAYSIGSDGTLGSPTVIDTIRTRFGGNRLITGIAFKPNSTATAMDLWVSSSQFAFGNNPSGSDPVQQSANNFTGEIDSLSGAGLSHIEPLVINIPRSVKDHTNNQIVFSPDGRTAYFGIAAMNAMGRADPTWGNRSENVYSATIMQLRTSGAASVYTYIRSNGAVNLMIDGPQNSATGVDANGNATGTHYNIFKGSNPLRIYADGIRNDYDMVFASNGHLYASINGSSSGGNTPGTPSDLSTVPTTFRPDKDVKGLAYTGPRAPALTNVATVEEDFLLDVKNGAYYGHPNASRGEYVIDGGNPTSGVDPYEFVGNGTNGYATGQLPDRNYTKPIYDFGQDYSPDGIIQYKSVNGKNSDLNNYVLICRYSSGGDILALQPNADGSIGKTQARIPGLTNLGTPLDVIEDPNTGNLYVAVLKDETGNALDSGSIQLLKPTSTSATVPEATANRSKISVYVTPGGKGASQSVTITNTGTAPLVLDRSATKITSSTGDRANFGVTNLPAADYTIAVGKSLTLNVIGALSKGQTGTKKGNLAVALNDPSLSGGYLIVHLYATDSTVPSTFSTGNTPASVFSQGKTISVYDSLIADKVQARV